MSISGCEKLLASSGPPSTIRWKAFDVDAAGEDVPLGAPDRGAGVGVLELPDRVAELMEGVVGEEVERRVREDDLADVAVALHADDPVRHHAPLISSAVRAISSGSPGFGTHGSFSGSSS